MNKYLIQIFWSDEDQGYIALVPDLPGCNAFGETQQQALAEVNIAIELWIQVCQQAGEPIPNPTHLSIAA